MELEFLLTQEKEWAQDHVSLGNIPVDDPEEKEDANVCITSVPICRKSQLLSSHDIVTAEWPTGGKHLD